MALKDFAYSAFLGKPIVLWLGILTLGLFLSAALVIFLNNYSRIRLPIEYHKWLALSGIVLAIVHAILAISAYI